MKLKVVAVETGWFLQMRKIGSRDKQQLTQDARLCLVDSYFMGHTHEHTDRCTQILGKSTSVQSLKRSVIYYRQMKHKRITNESGMITVGIVFVLALVLIGGIGLVVFSQQKSSSKKNAAPTSQAESKTNSSAPAYTKLPDTRDADKKTNEYRLHGSLMAYEVTNGHYLEATPAAWAKFAERYKTTENSALIDPYTDTLYTFTNKTPEYGEIEYRFPASCNDARTDFIAATTSQSWAFRLKYSNGIHCTHNI